MLVSTKLKIPYTIPYKSDSKLARYASHENFLLSMINNFKKIRILVQQLMQEKRSIKF